MPRLNRLQAILTRLQSKQVVTARELADHFGVSIRSIYRDLRTLEEAGIPVGAEAGIGYFLPDNFHLPPVMFTTDEALSLLMGGKLTERFTDQRESEAFGQALTKIRSVLRPADKETLAAIESRIEVFQFAPAQPRHLHLFELKKALAQNLLVEIDYQKEGADSSENRTIEPLALCFYSGNWHLMAWCRLREAYRDFRTDRINTIKIPGNTFDLSKHPPLIEIFGQNGREATLHHITLEVGNQYAENIHEMKYAWGFSGQEKHSKTTIMHFFNTNLQGFARWVVWGGTNIRVISPESLRDEVQDIVRQLADHHCK